MHGFFENILKNRQRESNNPSFLAAFWARIRALLYASFCAGSLARRSDQTEQHDDHDQDGHDHAGEAHDENGDHHGGCGEHEEEGDYDPVSTVMEHIADANEFHVWKDVHIPLPLFLYAPDHGWTTGFSTMFHHGHSAVDGYVLNHGRVNRIADPAFPKGEVHIDGILHEVETRNRTPKERKQKRMFTTLAPKVMSGN